MFEEIYLFSSKMLYTTQQKLFSCVTYQITYINASVFFFFFQVNNNGHLSFDFEVPVYQPTLRLGSDYKLIAAFLADVDTTEAGSVYYRLVSGSGVALNWSCCYSV